MLSDTRHHLLLNQGTGGANWGGIDPPSPLGVFRAGTSLGRAGTPSWDSLGIAGSCACTHLTLRWLGSPTGSSQNPKTGFHTTHSVSNPKGSSPGLPANQQAPEYRFPVHLTAEPGGILPKETLGAHFSGPGGEAQGTGRRKLEEQSQTGELRS